MGMVFASRRSEYAMLFGLRASNREDLGGRSRHAGGELIPVLDVTYGTPVSDFYVWYVT
jgi:hypothetical protein